VHYLLFYDVVPDYLTRRATHRPLHLEYARKAVERGELVLGGVLDDPTEPVMLFSGTSPEVAEGFARKDPYVLNGLVRSWRVREWKTVVGAGAAHSV